VNRKSLWSGVPVAVTSISCLYLALALYTNMKKLFSKIEKNEKIDTTSKEAGTSVGKVFKVGTHSVQVEDVLAEGEGAFILIKGWVIVFALLKNLYFFCNS